MSQFDVVVIGLGAIGSSALYALAGSEARVIGIDRFNPPHAFGSSHGETRITRQAIGEGPVYVPLVVRSNEILDVLGSEFGEPLIERCGFLLIARNDATTSCHGKPGFLATTLAAAELVMACPVSDRETGISASHIASPNGILRMFKTRFICARKSRRRDHRGRSASPENGTPAALDRQRSSAPAVSDRLAPARCARRPEARQCPRPGSPWLISWHIILIVAQPGRKRDPDASVGEPPAFGKIVEDHFSRVFV